MNNRFKFRFYDKENKIMVYADTNNDLLPYHSDEIYTTWQTYDLSAIENLANNEDYIVMQCTGLKDKNGKLIYEGDIVEAKQKPDREGWYCVYCGIVKYDNKNCQYVINSNQHKVLNENKLIKSALNTDTSFNWFDWFEVIGNIYENPELLEVEE
jgi:uncharacterized phage protein (TIGR01671 family)